MRILNVVFFYFTVEMYWNYLTFKLMFWLLIFLFKDLELFETNL